MEAIDAEPLRIFFIHFDRVIAELAEDIFVAHGGAIPLAGDGDAEKPLSVAILLPFL